jgi:hypothetical protein
MKKNRLYNGKMTVKARVKSRIFASKDKVFIPKDFAQIASYAQVLRALKELIKDKKIVRLGYGLYAKADINPFDGNVYPKADDVTIGKEILRKLKIKWDYSQAVKEYNAFQSTQIPIKNMIVVKGRLRRQIESMRGVYA